MLLITLPCVLLAIPDTTDVEKSFKERKSSSKTEEALRLSALGSLKHQHGNYEEALEYYQNSLKIRKELGLKHTNSYANTLFLTSIAHHKVGKSCLAYTEIKEVIHIYNHIGNEIDGKVAEEEAKKTFLPACNEGKIALN